MSKVYPDDVLFDFGSQRTFGAEATEVGFLIGGIGTGAFSIGQRGQFKDWEIFNSPGKGNYLPYTFFAIRTQEAGSATALTKVLEARLEPPFSRSHGIPGHEVGGLPRFRRSTFKGEYPFATVELTDDEMPVEVTMEAFNPLIPLNADDSGIPVGIVRYTVNNRADRALNVSVAGSMANMSVLKEYDRAKWNPYFTTDQPHNEYVCTQAAKGLYFRPATLDRNDFHYGTMALMSDEKDITYKRAWLNDGWWDGLQDFWDDFRADGRLEPESEYAHKDAQAKSPGKIGSLSVQKALGPGEIRTFTFVIAWHFPQRIRSWSKEMYEKDVRCDVPPSPDFQPPPCGSYPGIKNYYATRFQDAWDAGEYTLRELERLERETRTFHSAFFGSTLPSYVLDAVSANMTVLRSPTCFRIEDGTLMGWEGCYNEEGAGEGNCTHVWNYAQTVANLFPELETSMRRLEYLVETEEDGKMNFRSYKLWGIEAHRHMPTADGQFGTIVRLYREWRMTGDDELLRDCWPNAKKSLEYGIRCWDRDGDGVTETDQFNTYDCTFHGPNSLVNSLFYAALAAASKMARYMGEAADAARYDQIFIDGSAVMDRLLWGGEYYIQQIDDPDEYRFQYGNGCLSDQLFGQTLAHLCGLGYILPEAHVKQAIHSVFRNNFRTTLADHCNTQRTYALNDESGLLMCSWPKGGRPRFPFPYSDEVWTGVEYHVATHLIYEGFLREGLTLVKSVRDRYDGVRRNPWSEVEFGNHYARSMASFGVYRALIGFQVDMTKGVVSFRPAIDVDRFSCFFLTGKAWGTYTAEKGSDGKRAERIDILYGDPASAALAMDEE